MSEKFRKRFHDYRKGKMSKKTTIIDVKLDEESKSELRFRLQDKEKPKTQRSIEKLVKNIAKFSLISKCYFPFYKTKTCFSADSLFSPYS